VPGGNDYCVPPVLELKFDELTGTTTYDTSGNGNDGYFVTTASSPKWWDVGKVGSALKFDDTDDYVQIKDDDSLDLATNFTLSLWFYRQNDTGAAEALLTKTDAADPGAIDYTYVLEIADSDKILFGVVKDGGGVAYLVSTSLIKTGRWYHVTATKDSTKFYIYLDGVLNDSGITVGTMGDPEISGFPVEVGRIGDAGAWQYFPGLIDDVKIYNYTRTAAQVTWDYNRGKPVAHWRFDECKGGTIYDESGNGNNGQLYLGGAAQGVTATGTCASSSPDTFWGSVTDSGGARVGRGAGSFDGEDDYVKINNNSNLTMVDRLTLSAWVYPTANGNSDGGRIVSKSNGTTGDDYALYYTYEGAGDKNLVTFRLSGNSLKTDDYILTHNTWNHVMGTWDGATRKIYVNGIEKANGLYSTSITDNDDDIGVGGHVDSGSTRTFEGKIDDVKIFNYALTPQQIRTEYNGGAVRFGD